MQIYLTISSFGSWLPESYRILAPFRIQNHLFRILPLAPHYKIDLAAFPLVLLLLSGKVGYSLLSLQSYQSTWLTCVIRSFDHWIRW